ncbi:MAG: DUF2321 domain-containing protein [candidate division Zixibacteria bacterium]|nr:DUF2321 domain-containing protein [candidate division Zixibacteria bacterium]
MRIPRGFSDNYDGQERRHESWHDVAQICTNGHVINRSSKKYPQHNNDFCDKCGQRTLTKCEKCGGDIRGEYHVEGVASFGGDFPAPAFCVQCGSPFPWTVSRLQAARELAAEMEELTEEERESLSRSLDDLIRDTPQTTVSVSRFKKVAKKISKEGLSGLREILIDIVSETAKKSIWPT